MRLGETITAEWFVVSVQWVSCRDFRVKGETTSDCVADLGETMMNRCYFLVAVLFFLPAMSLGQSPAPQDDVADRMNRLEAETQALRQEVKRLREDTVRLPAVDATQTAVAAAPEPQPFPEQRRRSLDKETTSPWTSFAGR